MLDSKKYILIYYVVVIVFIGLPIWYKTTSPVRYKLPDVKSLMVHSQRTVNRVQINVIDVAETTEGELNYEEMKDDFQNNWSRYDSRSKDLIYEFQWVVRRLKNDVEDKLFADDLNASDELSRQLKVRYKQGKACTVLRCVTVD